MNEEIVVGRGKLQIEVKPATLIFNKSQKDIKYPDRVVIDPQSSLAHFDSIKEIDKYTASLFSIVYPDYSSPILKSYLNDSSIGHRHIIGLFSLTIQLITQSKKFVWRYPETYVHPAYQGNIADVMIILGNEQTLIDFVKAVDKGLYDEKIVGI